MEESVWKARRASRVEQRDAHFMHEKDHAGDNGACIRTCDTWCVIYDATQHDSCVFPCLSRCIACTATCSVGACYLRWETKSTDACVDNSARGFIDGV